MGKAEGIRSSFEAGRMSVRAVATDWLSHWILILMGGAVGIYWGWWGLLGAVVGWSLANLIFRLGATSNQERKP